MKASSLLLVLWFAYIQAPAQDVVTKFSTEVCDCFKKLKLESITASATLQQNMAGCYSTSISAHEKELKKKKIIDFDMATEEEMAIFLRKVFTFCPEAAKAAYERVAFLENEEAAGSFQGIIFYVQSIAVSNSVKKMGLTKEMLLDEMKKKGTWADTLFSFHRLGDYARIGSNKEQSQKIYIADQNTIYSFSTIGNGVCSVQEAVDLDLNGAPDKPTVSELDSAVNILGLPCKIMRMKWKLSQLDYYYNTTQAQVNPALFANHSSEGLAEFMKRTKCLPLQIVTNIMGISMVQTAVEIRPGKVETDMFALPELVEDASLNVLKLPGIKMMRIKE